MENSCVCCDELYNNAKGTPQGCVVSNVSWYFPTTS